ncbi:hypothetical protein INR49_025371 [Caranx melampygus]|nr:hypothetical protein INR49_025371 [Caranx melampygus]
MDLLQPGARKDVVDNVHRNLACIYFFSQPCIYRHPLLQGVGGKWGGGLAPADSEVFVACQRTLVRDSTLLPALVSPQLQEKPLRQERPLTQEVQPTSDCMSQSSDRPPLSSSSSFHFSSRTRIST